MTLRIATSQPAGSADARHNGRTARQLMRRAAAEGARLIQFPEGFLSGYAKEQIADWDDVDWAAVHEELRAVSELAAELEIWVVLGSEHPLTPPHRPHNSLYVISDRGRVVTRYDKRFCSNTEITRFYSPGFEPVVFDVDGYRFGCAICIEVNFPLIGPDGSHLASVDTPERPATVVLDRTAPEFHIALDLARPWRAEANRGDIYRSRRLDDPRSTDRTVV
jgi:predicted amidohydrolase